MDAIAVRFTGIWGFTIARSSIDEEAGEIKSTDEVLALLAGAPQHRRK